MHASRSAIDDPLPHACVSNNAHLVAAMAQLQRKDSDDDLLAGWSGELEALLYSPEVEEAIKEVSPCYY